MSSTSGPVICMKMSISACNLTMLITSLAALGVTYSYAGVVRMLSFASVILLSMAIYRCTFFVSPAKYTRYLYIGALMVLLFGVNLVIFIFHKGLESAVEAERDVKTSFMLLDQGYSTDFLEIQKKFKCCGYNSVHDYHWEKVPPSCCPGQTSCSPESAFTINCTRAVWLYESAHALTLVYFHIALIVPLFAIACIFIMLYVAFDTNEDLQQIEYDD